MRPIVILLALSASTGLSRAAHGQHDAPAHWRLALRAERTHLGEYLAHRDDEDFARPGSTATRTRATTVRLDRMRGARAELRREGGASRWLLGADVGWAHGVFDTMVAERWTIRFDQFPDAMDAMSEMQSRGEAVYWTVGAGVGRAFGEAGARVQGALHVRPSITMLTVPLMTDPLTPMPPSLGPNYAFPEPRAHRYVRPALALGADASFALFGGLALEVAGTATVLRTAGGALASDLAKQPWTLSGSGPVADGRDGFVPVTTLGFGLSYRRP